MRAAEFPWPLRAGSFRCPAHEDRTPSLSVRYSASGRWLVYCHAGCSTEKVLEAAGRTFADLIPGRRPRHPRAVPPPAQVTDSAAIIAEALALERAQMTRLPLGGWGPDDVIRAKRRVAYSARHWAAKWGDCEASWRLLALAAELETEAHNREVDRA